MDLQEESSKLESLATATSRRLSSASSVFYSANPSPFFSPSSSKSQRSDSTRTDIPLDDGNVESRVVPNPEPDMNHQLSPADIPKSQLAKDLQILEQASSSTGVANETSSSRGQGRWIEYSRHRDRRKKVARNYGVPFAPNAASVTTSRIKNCDIYIGLHGRKPSLLRFANWLRAELEVQGVSCFASDRARCRNSRKQRLVERAMDICSFGVVIVTKKSFKNPYTIEELRFFSSKKNLIPLFFDVAPSDCLVRDIIERRGDLWEKHGGEVWNFYSGLEKEWKEAIYGLSRVDECKLEAHNGHWRECILRTVTLLATKLGRRSVVERLGRWKEKAEKEEFPFPRNDNFTGRKKELAELEFMLFGNVAGDSEGEYFEIKTKTKRDNVTINWSRSNSLERRRGDSGDRKGKDPVIWKESAKEIEMQSIGFPQQQHHHHSSRVRTGRKYARRKRSMRIVYGKGVAVVSGESGIGKTELLLEFAYRYHQKYKMVLWIGGESRYIRQNYLNLWPFFEIDVGLETCAEKGKIKGFQEQEEGAIFRVRRELMRNLPYLVIIDNLESEKDWWDHRLIMDLLPRFGGETHFLISTRLPRVMNLEPMKLSYLSGVEALSLMQGSTMDHPLPEIDALRVIEEKLGRITLGLAIVGAILSELPINPTRLLDTINRMPLRDFSCNGKEVGVLRRNTFLLQLFEVCFSIFDHADGPRSLATRMVQASGWFAPSPIPISVLAAAATKIPEKLRGTRLWKKILRSLRCGFTSNKRSELEAGSILLRFNIARSSIKEGYIHFNELVKLYARRKGITGVAHGVVQAVINRGSVVQHSDHLWAACFLIFGFGNDPVVVELKVSDLLTLVKEVVLPLAIRAFITFSRCSAALELLRLCTNALETADQSFVTPVEKWLDKSLCWRPVTTNAQLNPSLWQDMALARATVLETRAKLLLRGGQFDIADDLVRKAIFIRTSISGENHPHTLSAKETLAKISRLLANIKAHTSP